MFEQFFPVSDPVPVFTFLILIALAAPLLSSKAKLPGIIGLIVAGILFGPNALRVLERGAEIQLLGTVGLLYIMFLAGLELDRTQFIRHRHHSLGFGVFTFTIPMFFGSLMVRYILNFSWPAAILLSSCFSSHTLITYPIASRLGLARHRAVTTSVGGTIFTDTLALMVLAVIAASHKGQGGILFWPQLFFFMAIYVVGTIIILPRLSRWFFRNLATDGIIAYTGILAAVFLSAYLAYLAGLEPIIGAFFAGLILNSFIPEKSSLMNRVQFVGHSLFIPFFLISVGMLVDVRMLFAKTETVIIAAVMVFAGITTKWLAAYLTQKLFKYTPDEGKLIYGLSVNQAAATLAAVLVGYNIGIFTEPVLTGTVIMILATSLAGSWITDRYARRVALEEEDQPYQPSDVPHRILVPLSNPRTAAELMNLAMLLRRRSSQEPLYPLTVVRSGDKAEERIAGAEKLLGHAVVQALEADIPVSPITRAAIDISFGVQQATVDLRISTIVAGWRDAPSHSRVFGKVLDSILDNTSQMMLVSRCLSSINTVKRVVVAVPPLIDHQPGFPTAIEAVKTLTHQLDASLLMASVVPTIEKARKIIQNSLPKLPETDVQLEKWGDLLPWLEKTLGKNDLLIIVSVRKGRLAWQPNLNRLPRLASEKFPNINQVIIYPPDNPWGDGIGTKKNKSFHPSFLPEDHIQLDLLGLDVPEAIRKLLLPAFLGHQEIAERIANRLVKMAQEEPMELAPGVVLLHSHISEIETSTVFLGVNEEGWEMPHIAGKAKVLFILLSSKDSPPEVHLKALADLAGPLHHFQAAEQLISLNSADKILKLFYKDQ